MSISACLAVFADSAERAQIVIGLVGADQTHVRGLSNLPCSPRNVASQLASELRGGGIGPLAFVTKGISPFTFWRYTWFLRYIAR